MYCDEGALLGIEICREFCYNPSVGDCQKYYFLSDKINL